MRPKKGTLAQEGNTVLANPPAESELTPAPQPHYPEAEPTKSLYEQTREQPIADDATAASNDHLPIIVPSVDRVGEENMTAMPPSPIVLQIQF